jgi:hypothetical protein
MVGDEEEKKKEEEKKPKKKPSLEDENYLKLNCKIESLEPGTPDHTMVKTYLDNTKSGIGGFGYYGNRLELIDAFKIER